MPTIDDAIRLAEHFARQEAAVTGKEIRGLVQEFEHGWAIWTVPPPGEAPPIGQGNKTVLDRETGQLTHWPSWSVDDLARHYAAHRPDLRAPHFRVLDPTRVELLDAVRSASLRSQDGRVWTQHSAVLDDLPEHHPLLAEFLAAQPPAELVRGAERHAHLWIISEVLHAAGPQALRDMQLDGSRIPCRTCVHALVHFGVVGERGLSLHPAHPGELENRFGPELDSAHWVDFAFDILEEPKPGSPSIPRLEVARESIRRHPLSVSGRTGPGRECWVSPFQTGITNDLRAAVPRLRAFSTLTRSALYPLGTHGDGGLIVIDDLGRHFLLDEGGAYYCGRDIDQALGLLLEGVRLPRVRQDGGLDT